MLWQQGKCGISKGTRVNLIPTEGLPSLREILEVKLVRKETMTGSSGEKVWKEAKERI